jgi:hypothetical protein
VSSAFSSCTDLGIAAALVVSEPPSPAPSGGPSHVQADAHLCGRRRSRLGADWHG